VFSERGYDGATFQAIAARADLTRPAINHYFSSKRALYREVMDETNKFVIGAGIKQAQGETTLVAQLTAFISAAVKANMENPAGSAFVIGGVLESQRHPEWSGTENDSIRIAREFLTQVVNDAIERGELVAGIDASALVETLLVVTSGVGLYAGYIKSYKDMLAVVGMLRQVLEGALWRPEA
jgi:AcrR family transcriptional regulator